MALVLNNLNSWLSDLTDGFFLGREENVIDDVDDVIGGNIAGVTTTLSCRCSLLILCNKGCQVMINVEMITFCLYINNHNSQSHQKIVY